MTNILNVPTTRLEQETIHPKDVVEWWYESYILSLQESLKTGGTHWVTLSKLENQYQAMLGKFYGSSYWLDHNFFDFCISLLEQNSYWAFILDNDYKVKDSYNRTDALLFLMNKGFISKNTEILSVNTTKTVTILLDRRIDVERFNAFSKSSPFDSCGSPLNPQDTRTIKEQTYYKIENSDWKQLMRPFNWFLQDSVKHYGSLLEHTVFEPIRFDFIMPVDEIIAQLKNLKTSIPEQPGINNITSVQQQEIYTEFYQFAQSINTEYYGYERVKSIQLRGGNYQDLIKTKISSEELNRFYDNVLKHNLPFFITAHISKQNNMVVASDTFHWIVALLQYGIEQGVLDSDLSILVLYDYWDHPIRYRDFKQVFPFTTKSITVPNLFTKPEIMMNYHRLETVLQEPTINLMTTIDSGLWLIGAFKYYDVLKNNYMDWWEQIPATLRIHGLRF